MTYYAIIILAGIVNLVCYAIICWKLRSWVNCFSIYFGFTIAIDVVFGFTGQLLFGPGGSIRSYLYIYGTEMGCGIVMMATAILFQGPRLNWYPRFQNTNIKYMPWTVLAIAIFMYLPVLVAFHSYLLDPRRIYEATRTGYGVSFFGSICLTNTAFVLYLFKKNKSRFEAVLFIIAAGLFLYEHGSKGSYLEPILIYLIYLVHVHGKRFSLTTSLWTAAIIIVFVAVSFLATSKTSTLSELLYGMTTFADYNRNSMLVFDTPMRDAPFYGKLMVEQEFYARVPRAIDPDKPKEYGIFRIAEHYQNAEYSADQGASAFGNIAYLYVNFGPFAVIFALLESGLTAYFSIGLLRRLKVAPSAGALLLLCFLSGASVIPVVEMFILPETLIIALIIDKIASSKTSRGYGDRGLLQQSNLAS